MQINAVSLAVKECHNAMNLLNFLPQMFEEHLQILRALLVSSSSIPPTHMSYIRLLEGNHWQKITYINLGVSLTLVTRYQGQMSFD